MADRRKLQGEIDRTLKKITEGVEVFQDIWQKIQAATNLTIKEKHEADLKKEIKKLQRLRDGIKTWVASSDIKDKKTLLEYKKLIEVQMERFKVIERETKTKAYSKEGLGAATKVDPKEKEKEDISMWLACSIEELNVQIDQFETEVENVGAKKKKLDKDKQDQVDVFRHHLDKHRFHIDQLETIMRLVNNDALDLGQIWKIKDDVEYYISSSRETDFEENEFLYDDLHLDEISAALGSKLAATSLHDGDDTTSDLSETTSQQNSSSPSPSPSLANTHSKDDDESSGQRTRVRSTTSSESSKPSNGPASSSFSRSMSIGSSGAGGGVGGSTVKHGGHTREGGVGSASTSTGPSKSLLLFDKTSTAQSLSHDGGVGGGLGSGGVIIPGSTGVSLVQNYAQAAGGSATHHQQQQLHHSSSVSYDKSGGLDVFDTKPISSSPLSCTSASMTNIAPTNGVSAPCQPSSSSSIQPFPPADSISTAAASQQQFRASLHQATAGGAAVHSLLTWGAAGDGGANDTSLSPRTASSAPDNTVLTRSQGLPDSRGPMSATNCVTSSDETVGGGTAKMNGPLSGSGAVLSPQLSSTVSLALMTNSTTSSLKAMTRLVLETAGLTTNDIQSAFSSSRSDTTPHGGAGAVSPPAPSTLSSLPASAGGVTGGLGGGTMDYQALMTSTASSAASTTTSTIRLHPVLGVAPLGTQPLDRNNLLQLAMLDAAASHLPQPDDSERIRIYFPRSPTVVPSYYCQLPPQISDSMDYFNRLSIETLFFIFYYMEGTKAQYMAAKALKLKSWRFHTKLLMWFQRHEEPKIITEEFEQGSYLYFDFEKWVQRQHEGFTFEYKYLEDHDLN